MAALGQKHRPGGRGRPFTPLRLYVEGNGVSQGRDACRARPPCKLGQVGWGKQRCGVGSASAQSGGGGLDPPAQKEQARPRARRGEAGHTTTTTRQGEGRKESVPPLPPPPHQWRIRPIPTKASSSSASPPTPPPEPPTHATPSPSHTNSVRRVPPPELATAYRRPAAPCATQKATRRASVDGLPPRPSRSQRGRGSHAPPPLPLSPPRGQPLATSLAPRQCAVHPRAAAHRRFWRVRRGKTCRPARRRAPPARDARSSHEPIGEGDGW